LLPCIPQRRRKGSLQNRIVEDLEGVFGGDTKEGEVIKKPMGIPRFRKVGTQTQVSP